MSRRCDLTGIGHQTGHQISHSNRKTKRRFVPNLQNVSFLSNILRKSIPLRVTPATIRTVDHNGGLDSYLLSTSNLKLTDKAKKLKRQLKKALENPVHAEKKEAAKPKKKAAKKPEKKIRPASKKKAAKKAEKATKAPSKKKAAKAAKPKKKAPVKKAKK